MNRWIAVALVSIVGGLAIGAAAENVMIESFGVGRWVRSIALCATAVGAPLAAAAALAGGVEVPSFAAMLGRRESRPRDIRALIGGVLLIATMVLALQFALGLAFDPRYRDFPDTALTAAIVPFALARLVQPKLGRRGRAEILAAAGLLLCGGYIAFNEGVANWQSIWFCTLLIMLALTLLRARDAQS
jgi:hypothetical protein